MESRPTTVPETNDQRADRNRFLCDVIEGLSKDRKTLSSKYLYDERGSRLFERICDLAEYYPTRTELRIMRDHVAEMASVLGPRCLLIEYGSGSSTKTRILLDHLEEPAGYVPVDISEELLTQTALDLANAYPKIPILPVCADFTTRFRLPSVVGEVKRRIAYFPGSTIGNFTQDHAKEWLAGVAELCGSEGGLLIGVDLPKDRQRLESAYDDAEGVTASFNLNVLARINGELGADFRCDQFRHEARYNEAASRIEMYLVSQCDQAVAIADVELVFEEGESILTEYSHKYSLSRFRRMATEAGFDVRKVWTDAERLFSVQYLTVR